MFAGPAFRPCTMITTAGAVPSGAPASTMGCPPCGSTRVLRRPGVPAWYSAIVDVGQARLDPFAIGFLPWRQFQIAPKHRQFLVKRESWRDGRHFEQHTARLAEVNRMEVAAVADFRRPQAVLQQLLPQPQLFIVT